MAGELRREPFALLAGCSRRPGRDWHRRSRRSPAVQPAPTALPAHRDRHAAQPYADSSSPPRRPGVPPLPPRPFGRDPAHTLTFRSIAHNRVISTQATRATRMSRRANIRRYGHMAAVLEVTFRDRRSLWLTHVGVRGSQGVSALRARTSRHRGLPSPPRPRAVKGTVVTVNPDADRSLRTACSGQVR